MVDFSETIKLRELFTKTGENLKKLPLKTREYPLKNGKTAIKFL